ncbi:MAG: TfoX N-terminal domain protein [Chthonomonadaceae bacterium]|nr:TfoX N-terminal domain protein [Chthonomonadaceae bacterium]
MDTDLEAMQEQMVNAIKTLPVARDWTFKPMFGGVSGYVEGRICASLSNIGLALKLSPDTQEQLLNLEGAKRLRYEPDAPESKQYIVVPERLCADAKELAVWVERSVDYVMSLPAPRPKPAKQKAAEK